MTKVNKWSLQRSRRQHNEDLPQKGDWCEPLELHRSLRSGVQSRSLDRWMKHKYSLLESQHPKYESCAEMGLRSLFGTMDFLLTETAVLSRRAVVSKLALTWFIGYHNGVILMDGPARSMEDKHVAEVVAFRG